MHKINVGFAKTYGFCVLCAVKYSGPRKCWDFNYETAIIFRFCALLYEAVNEKQQNN